MVRYGCGRRVGYHKSDADAERRRRSGKIIKVLDLVSIVNAKIQENKETSQKEKMLPDGMGIIGAVAVLLAALLSFFAYKFGRAQEKIDHEREKSKTAAYIRSLRRRLDNSDIVERLHDTFKR